MCQEILLLSCKSDLCVYYCFIVYGGNFTLIGVHSYVRFSFPYGLLRFSYGLWMGCS